MQGDWGASILTGRPVLQDVLIRLPVTLELIVLSMGVALVIAIPAAIIGALRQNTWADYTATSVAMIGVSIPEFFIGVLLLLVFSIGLGGLLPSSGWVYLPGTCPTMVCGVSLWGNMQHVLMPALALGVGRAAHPDPPAPREHAGGHPHRVRHHRARQGPGRAAGRVQARAQERPDPDRHRDGPAGRASSSAARSWWRRSSPCRASAPSASTRSSPATTSRCRASPCITALAFVVINLLVDLTYTFLDPRIRYA